MEKQRTVQTRIIAHLYVSTVEKQVNDFAKQLVKENKEIIDFSDDYLLCWLTRKEPSPRQEDGKR